MGMSIFSAASMTISIFSAIQVFAWLATVWKGHPVPAAPFKFSMGFIALLVIGGLNGITTAVIPLDWQIHDTYFVVSHLHYVLVGTNLFPVVAAFYYWVPKMTGRMLSERLGTWSFWLMFIGLNVAFFPMHLLGIMGMTRRIYTYPSGLGWSTLNMISSIGAYVLAIGILVTIVNFFRSRKYGPPAGKDPWKADSLEWSTDSPPAPYASEHIPTVETRHPLWDSHLEEEDPGGRRILDQGRLTLATTALDADVESISRMPEDTLAPLIMTLAMTVFFTALLFKALWVLLASVLAMLAINAWWLWPEEEKRPS
jgi:cytochrome c oxidase subunit I+III